MSTVKISNLANLVTMFGNVTVPVAANVAGGLATRKATVDQFRTFILGSLSTDDLANMSANVTTLFSNAAVQAGNIAQLVANAAVQSGILANLEANAIAQTIAITNVQTNLNNANVAMNGYVNSLYNDIVNGISFTGNINIGDITIANVGGKASIFATDTDGNINLIPQGTGVVDTHSARISNVSDPQDAQDAVTLSYLSTALSSSVTNLILDDTEVVITDDGIADGSIGFTVDGNAVLTMNPANTEVHVETIVYANLVTTNILPSTDITYSLGSNLYRWKDIFVSNSSIHIGPAVLTVENGDLIIDGNNHSSNIVSALGNISISQSNIATLQSQVATLESNAIAQHQSIISTESNVVTNTNDINTLQQNVVDIVADYANVTANISAIQLTASNTIANVSTLQGAVANLTVNAEVQSGQIASVQSNVITANTAITGYVNAQVVLLTANAAVQAGQIASVQSNVTTANTAMRGYVDSQDNSIISAWTANAAVQAGQIASVQSNVITANTAMKGYVDSQDNSIISAWTANAAVQAGQIASLQSAVSTANTAMKGYVDGQVASLTANAAVQSGQIASTQSNVTTANTAMKGYVDTQISSTQSNVTTANTAMKGYVDTQISSTQSNVTTANTAMKGYVDTRVSILTSNAAVQAGAIAARVAKTGDTMTGNLTLQGAFPVLFLDSTTASGGIELGFAASGENFVIFEPEDSDKEWFKIPDESFTGDSNAYIYGSKIVSANNYSSFASTYSGVLRTSGIINANSNGVGNIGNTSNRFNTVFAKATSAVYADLAEKYTSDSDYEIGTVVVFGGTHEVTVSDTTHDHRIAGVISAEPAYLMNSTLVAGCVVALTGRVVCKVVGTIQKGDLLVQSNILGVATSLNINDWQPGCVIGKALETYDSLEVGQIEIVVGRI